MPAVRNQQLDALRAFAFSLLILFHVGMLFNLQAWYVKNDIRNGWLALLMQVVSQWRLPLVFAVSGAAAAYYLERSGETSLFKFRLYKLGPAIVLALLILSPLQIWLENYWLKNLAPAAVSKLTPFTLALYPAGWISLHHLWFLAYLLIITLCHVMLRRLEIPSLVLQALPMLLGLGLYLSYLLQDNFGLSVTPDPRSTWGSPFALLRYGIFYAFGYLGIRRHWLPWLIRIRYWLLAMAGLATAYLLMFYWKTGNSYTTYDHLISACNRCLWLAMLFGFSQIFSKAGFHKLNSSLLFFYVMHQPILLGLAVVILPITAHWFLKFMILLLLLLLSLFLLRSFFDFLLRAYRCEN